MQDINYRYIELAKQNGFNPVLLKEIVQLRNKGYTNVEIAENLGVSRNTVTKYLKKLRNTDNQEFLELLMLIVALIGGAVLIAKLFKNDGR